MCRLRLWLNQHALGAPYRWLRDWLFISANRRELLAQIQSTQGQIRQSQERLDEEARQLAGVRQRLDSVETGLVHGLHAHTGQLEELARQLAQLAPLYRPGDLPFSHAQPAPAWTANAERVLGQRLAELPEDQREHWFYSFYSEMAGGLGHILQQQYQAYLPRLPRLPEHRLLDIGCGAGEFLSFLGAHGMPAMGIDLDAHEVERARARGLDAVQGEAVEYLSSCRERFAAISLLQVIEHVPPSQVRPLIEACSRSLAPGGVLLVETVNLRHPNALNGFHTDPTHQVPLSDNYLSFLFQWYGLQQVELLYTLPEWLPGISAEDPPRCYANYTVVGYRSD